MSAMVAGTALRVNAKADTVEALHPVLDQWEFGPPGVNMALVQVAAAAVNPSDVKAALGFMPYAVFPRTPGRDFAGTVVAGPAESLGQKVFGSSGDLGIRQDGSHATHLLVEAAACVPLPSTMSLEEAAGVGVPFITAMEGFRRAGMPVPGEVVVVMGVTGKVGQAAAQIATWRGARVIGVMRGPGEYMGHASAPVDVIDASACDVAEAIRALTGGHGADIVFNTVGDPYFDAAHRGMAKLGRHIMIAAIERIVPFNIFEFYRGRHSYYGIDSLALTSVEAGDLLNTMLPGFALGDLRPFPIVPHARYALADAAMAYTQVVGSSRDRIVLVP